jgi:pyrroloquinoline-quinone synthase
MTALKVKDTTSWDVVSENVRKRNSIEFDVKEYLDGILLEISNHRAVQHPFLEWYKTNTLTIEQELQLYSECYYFFQYLPFYITGMAVKTKDENILREIVLNVYDEVGHKVTHSEIYKMFLEKIGINFQNVSDYTPLQVTTDLNLGIKELYTNSDIEKSLGALYADETMSSIMVSSLNDGLENQGYNKSARHFWILHIEVELGHSNSVFNAISPHLHSVETREKFESGVNRFLFLLENYWDGVQEKLGVMI